METNKQPVLIVDAANLFVRSYCAFPTMSSHGYQMGGCIGFLKTLQKIIQMTQPSAIYIAWESGGSSRRRALFSEYKMNRRPEKLNRFYEDDIPDTDENRQHQNVALVRMLSKAPVCQIYVPDCEGDDVIAYLCKIHLAGQEKIIVSSDKDLYQLMDEKTTVYSLHKKRYVTAGDVKEEFRVSAQNFGLAKALCGDVTDNVPGIKGLGFKTVAKIFPFLGLDEPVLVQDVLDYCHVHIGESALYKRIIECEADLRRNWRLVYLDGGMLSASQAAKVDAHFGTCVPTSDRMGLVKLLIREGIGDFDTESFFYAFNGVHFKVKGTEEQ